MVDMSADHAVGAVAFGDVRQRHFEIADIVDRLLELALRPLRHGPIGQPERLPHAVDRGVERKRRKIGAMTDRREVMRALHHPVEMIAMHDKITAPIGAGMDRLIDDLYAGEMHAAIVAQERVVISRDVNDARTLIGCAEKLHQHVAMGGGPIPVRAQPPAVDNVADEINRVRAIMPQEIGKPVATT